MRAWHNAESVRGNLTLLCEFFVFQKNTWFFIRRVKCFLHTFAKPCRRYGKAEEIPLRELADRTATQKEGIRKLRVGMIEKMKPMKKDLLTMSSLILLQLLAMYCKGGWRHTMCKVASFGMNGSAGIGQENALGSVSDKAYV